MSVEVLVMPASEGQARVLRHLMRLYVYDFSDLMGLDVEEDGAFKVPELISYWRDPWRHPFLLRVEGKLAGFALVHQRSRLGGAEGKIGRASCRERVSSTAGAASCKKNRQR